MRTTAIALVAAFASAAACTSSGGGAPASAPVPAPHSSRASAASGSSSAPVAGASSPGDWPTYHGDAQRSGYTSSMPAAITLRVQSRLALDGAVYASPIVANDVAFVATENDTVYALDLAEQDRQLWKTQLGTPSPASERPCGNIDPLGITGTPVYRGGFVYVVAEYGAPVRHELVVIDAHTGQVRQRTSLDLPGVDATAMQQRGALTIAGDRVWVPFGGLDGDCGAYKGRLVGVRLDGTGAPIAFTVPTSREGGIWTPPGPSVDASGHLLVAVGNGASGPGDAYDDSDSVLAINPADAGLLDSFAPAAWASDNAADLDLGSQGPALVGQWVFAAGKSGTAYVLRRTRLGGIGGQVSAAQLCRSFGGTAVVADVAYVPCTDGVRAVRIDGAGRLHVIWHAGPAGSPVVGGGRVWTIDAGRGVLHGLDPATGRSSVEVSVGTTSRFATPAISNTRLLVPTLAGLTVVVTA